MTEEPASLMLGLLRQMRAELGDVRSDVSDVRSDIGQIRSDMATQSDLRALRADVAADVLRPVSFPSCTDTSGSDNIRVRCPLDPLLTP